MDSFANFSSTPPYYGRQTETFYDEGQGIQGVDGEAARVCRGPFAGQGSARMQGAAG